MSGFGLLAPWALLGLTTLLLPLLLHLEQRVQRSERRFAALRWLRPLQRPRRRWRLRQPWLLLLRCLLAVLLVLLLAEAVQRPTQLPAQVLLHPALPAPAVAQLPPAAQLRWWSPGLPLLSEQPTAPPPPAAPISLLREFDDRLPPGTSLQIWLPTTLQRLDAALPQLSRAVDWRIVDLPAGADIAPAELPLWAIQPGTDDSARRWLGAAAAALAEVGRIRLLELDLGTDAAALQPLDVLLWPEATPWPPAVQRWLEDGGRLYWSQPCTDCEQRQAVWRSDDGARHWWLRGIGRGQLLQPDHRIDPATLPELLEADFPQRLHDALMPTQPPALAPAAALQPLPGATARGSLQLPLDGLLTWLLLVLLLAERLLAAQAARRPSPEAVAPAP